MTCGIVQVDDDSLVLVLDAGISQPPSVDEKTACDLDAGLELVDDMALDAPAESSSSSVSSIVNWLLNFDTF